MAQTLSGIMNGHSGMSSGGGSPFFVNSPKNAPDREVELSNTLSADLEEIISSGITRFELYGQSGTLSITNNTQLIPNPDGASDGFCIVNFRDTLGQFKTFEIDLSRGAITVARKPKKDPRTQKMFITSFLGHTDMMPLFESLIRDAKVQIPKPPKETEVTDELRAMRGKFLAVLKIPLF
ncbi:MAG: hypothetical protein NTX63_03470 [Candidatus Peregrinibacteria bacterium]|nr:hypothetical protein [Candidatus Peregrinibacteria bacterium]